MHNLVVSCLAIASISYSMASPSYCGALSSCWDASSWRSCADSMSGLPDGSGENLFCGQCSETLS